MVLWLAGLAVFFMAFAAALASLLVSRSVWRPRVPNKARNGRGGSRAATWRPLPPAASAAAERRWVPWREGHSGEDTLVVDCTHSSALTLTHHKGHKNPGGIRPADTSTALALNALADPDGPAAAHLQQHSVMVNHFDLDALRESCVSGHGGSLSARPVAPLAACCRPCAPSRRPHSVRRGALFGWISCANLELMSSFGSSR